MQPFKHRFVLAPLAVFLICGLMLAAANFLYRNISPAKPDPSTNPVLASPMPSATSTGSSTLIPIIQADTPFPTLPETPLVASTTTISIGWMPLGPVSMDNRGLITNGNRSEYKVALTFDVCQREGDLAGYDAEIVRVLNETRTPATFFLGGLWMQDHPAETLELAGNPLFELGNHSWSHEDFSIITNDEMQQQVQLTQKMMYGLLGYQTNLFRLPYGTYNDEALNMINDNGLYVIQWDDVSGDPDPNVDAESMTSWVLQQVQPGSIIIMHANGRGWHTAEALPGIIQSLREQGYTPVTVSELLQIQPYK